MFYKKVCSQKVSFGELYADIIEFENFLLQLKKYTSGDKTVGGFSIIFILEGVIRF